MVNYFIFSTNIITHLPRIQTIKNQVEKNPPKGGEKNPDFGELYSIVAGYNFALNKIIKIKCIRK